MQSVDSKEQVAGSRWRLHWFTTLVVLLVIAVQILVMIPGHPAIAFPTSISTSIQLNPRGSLRFRLRRTVPDRAVIYQHGWPWVYFKSVRIEPGTAAPQGRQLTFTELKKAYGDSEETQDAVKKNSPYWSRLERANTFTWTSRSSSRVSDEVAPWRKNDAWRHGGVYQRIDGLGLLLNLLVVLALAMAMAYFVETWMRNGLSLSQFNLGQIIAVMTISALVLRWAVIETRAHRLSLAIENSVVPVRCTTSTANTPVWIARLWGLKNCTWFKRVSTLSIGEPMWVGQEQADLDELAYYVRNYGRLTDLSIEKEGSKVWRFVEQAGQLRSVRVWQSRPNRPYWESLATQCRWGKLQFME
jgi:hypothetical protein